jgi:hypothetical protein
MMERPVEGRLHRYLPESNLTLLEHLPIPEAPTTSNSPKPNTLIFVGGLYDSFLSVPYVPLLSSYVTQCPGWSVMEIQLSSSGLGWGTCDLNLDAEEIGKAVQYLRQRAQCSQSGPSSSGSGGKIVLMGHSTGSQGVLHYIHHISDYERPLVDGAILQAPVSDREGLDMMRQDDEKIERAYKDCLRIARKASDSTTQMLPRELAATLGWSRGLVSCRRFLSLTSPSSPQNPEQDDLFSSDLSADALKHTFGKVGSAGVLKAGLTSRPTILVLLSAQDQFMPKTVDKEALVGRWAAALEEGGTIMATSSGLVAGASHNVKEPKSMLEVTARVLRYLHEVVGGVPEAVNVQLSRLIMMPTDK